VHLVNWDVCCKPKYGGGLGFKRPRMRLSWKRWCGILLTNQMSYVSACVFYVYFRQEKLLVEEKLTHFKMKTNTFDKIYWMLTCSKYLSSTKWNSNFI